MSRETPSDRGSGSAPSRLRRRLRPRTGVVSEIASGDPGAVFLQGGLDPGEVVGLAGQRDAPVAVQRIEARGVFVRVGAVDGVVVIEAVDARARAVAGDDDRRTSLGA